MTSIQQRHPGAHARSPLGVPLRGWGQILRRAGQRSAADRVPLMAAGVAFFAFLALFPALIALIMVYGLLSDPEDISRHIEALAGVLPGPALTLVSQEMDSLVQTDRQGLGLGLVIALAAALWSASLGVTQLITAVNAAYEEQEQAGFIRRRLRALAITGAATVVFCVLVALVAVFPALRALGGLPAPVWNLLRWVALVAVVVVTLGAVYRYAPARRAARVPWVSVGALVATAIWIIGSAGFSLYVTHFGRYAETYGALAGVAVILLWLWLSSLAVLFGAEVNAEAEHQTEADTTTGEDRPRGERGAVKADTAVGRPPETER